MRRESAASCPDDGAPFVLALAEGKALRISAASPAALALGIEPGLGLADARARCPHLLCAPAEPASDAHALLKLARWCGRYGPALNLDGPDGLWIDVTGVAHLFGGEKALLRDLCERLARFGVTARAGLAGTRAAAWALARFSASPSIAPPGGQVAALASLPVEALRLAPDEVRLLRRLGLKRIGQLATIPRAGLKRRFPSRDDCEAVLLRLDQAMGVRAEPAAPLAPSPFHCVRAAFPDPLISSEGVSHAVAGLADDLCAALDKSGLGARAATLTLWRCDGGTVQLRAGASAPSRDAGHLLRLFAERLASADLGAGVDVIALATQGVERLGASQKIFLERETRLSAARLIDRLSARIGAAQVFRLERRDSHIPERAVTRRSAMRGEAKGEAMPAAPQRPLLMLGRPEPIAVIAGIPEGPPLRFTWRRLTRCIVRWQGPERIAPEWWREIATRRPSRPRDYYRVEDEQGARYWVFRDGLYQRQGEDGPPAWYVHGLCG